MVHQAPLVQTELQEHLEGLGGEERGCVTENIELHFYCYFCDRVHLGSQVLMDNLDHQ